MNKGIIFKVKNRGKVKINIHIYVNMYNYFVKQTTVNKQSLIIANKSTVFIDVFLKDAVKNIYFRKKYLKIKVLNSFIVCIYVNTYKIS